MKKQQCPTCRGCTKIISFDKFKKDKQCPTCKGKGVIEIKPDTDDHNRDE